MPLLGRPYRDRTDLAHMRQLLMVGTRARIPASYAHPGCLDWATHCPPDEAAMQRNLYVWEAPDGAAPEMRAWAIHMPNEGSFDLFVHPAVYGTPLHARAMDEYVAWAERRARSDGLTQLWPFWAMDHDRVLIDLMQARGFTITSVNPPPPLFERGLDTLPEVRLPAGYTVQGVHSLEAGRQRAVVTHSAFQSTEDWPSYWATYKQFMDSVVYDGERDVLVCAPDGRGAAACTLWFDPVNAVGLFEPVATHADFQGQGLGKAVMAEGMRRMQAAGMRRATLGFDPNNVAALALYSALGFAASAYFVVARKEL